MGERVKGKKKSKGEQESQDKCFLELGFDL